MSFAIICGHGRLPILVTQAHKPTLAIMILDDDSANATQDYANLKNVFLSNNVKIAEAKFGDAGKILQLFKENGITSIAFAGSIKKPNLYAIRTNLKGIKLLLELIFTQNKGDNSILSKVIKFFEKRGITVIPVDQIIPECISKPGLYTATKPTQSQINDANIGLDLIKTISKFDVGQSLVIQNGTILGIEALEGTANLIQRCSELKISPTNKPILIKGIKKDQTRKADLPTIGPTTIQDLHNHSYSGIFIEAGSTIILDHKDTIALANKLNIFIYGI